MSPARVRRPARNEITGPILLLVRLSMNAFRLCFQIVLIAGSIDNNASGFIRESCAGTLFADRVVDVILFSRLIVVDRRNQTILHRRWSKWKTREKKYIWTGRCSNGERGIPAYRASPLGGLDYFAMVQSTPSDLYFRNRSAKADRPTGDKFDRSGTTISSQTRQCRPRCFVTTGCDCRAIKVDSLQMNWKVPAGNSPSRVTRERYAQGRILLFLFLSISL